MQARHKAGPNRGQNTEEESEWSETDGGSRGPAARTDTDWTHVSEDEDEDDETNSSRAVQLPVHRLDEEPDSAWVTPSPTLRKAEGRERDTLVFPATVLAHVPSLYQAVPWSLARQTSTSALSRRQFRDMNRWTKSTRHGVLRNTYSVDQRFLKQYMPWIRDLPKSRRRVTLNEVSFAQLNREYTPSLSRMEEAMTMFHTMYKECPLRSVQQCLSIDTMRSADEDRLVATIEPRDVEDTATAAPGRSWWASFRPRLSSQSTTAAAVAVVASGKPDGFIFGARDTGQVRLRPLPMGLHVTKRFLSSRETDAQPFASSRLAALATASEMQPHGKWSSLCFVHVLDHFVVSGPGTCRLYPWTGSSPHERVYHTFGYDPGTHIRAWNELLRGPGLESTHVHTTMMLAVELAYSEQGIGKSDRIPSSPDEARREVHRYMRPVWKDRDLAGIERDFATLLDIVLPNVVLSFYDTVVYQVVESGPTLLDAMRDMATSELATKSLTVEELRNLNVWFIQFGLLATARMQSGDLHMTHQNLTLDSVYLVEDPPQFKNATHFHWQVPRDGTMCNLYLPRTRYKKKWVSCRVGGFDFASSSLHAVHGGHFVELPWFDLLTAQADYDAFRVEFEGKDVDAGVFDQAYRRLMSRTDPGRAKSLHLYVKSDEDERNELEDDPEDGEDEEEEEKVVARRPKSPRRREPVAPSKHLSPQEPHDAIDFPILSKLAHSFGTYTWYLNAEDAPERDESKKTTDKAIFLGLLSPTVVLTSAEVVQSSYCMVPPRGAVIHAFDPFPPPDRPRVPADGGKSLSEVWRAHMDRPTASV